MQSRLERDVNIKYELQKKVTKEKADNNRCRIVVSARVLRSRYNAIAEDINLTVSAGK